jgi:type II secretion system protein C
MNRKGKDHGYLRWRLSFFSFLLFECLLLLSYSFSAPRAGLSQDEKAHSSSLSLIGIVVSKDASSSIAILKNGEKGKIFLLKTGETVFDLKLVRVWENGIILEKEGARHQIFVGESLSFGGENRVKKNPAVNLTEAVEKRPEGDSLTNSLSASEGHDFKKMELVRSDVKKRIQLEWPVIMKETRFVPNYLNGQVSGFKIINLPEKGILSETGILENDVIKKVNGIELNDLAAFFRLYDELKDENQCEVTIERGGKPFRLLFVLK